MLNSIKGNPIAVADLETDGESIETKFVTPLITVMSL